MNLQNRLSHRPPLIEPLEQRIAPALLVYGANLLGGPGNPSSGQTSIGGNTVTLVSVLSGECIVWYNHGFISTISVGPNTSLNITGDVGTIVGNLTASGKLSDSDNNPANGLDGDVLLPNNILGITTHPLGSELGTIGNIITGGSVSNLSISGNLEGVFAGTGAFYTGNRNPLLDSHVLSGNEVVVGTGAVDVNPILPGVQNGFVFPASDAKTVESGASITGVKILGSGEELQMIAGAGFAGTASTAGHPGTAGQPGGSISNVLITNAFIDTGLNASTPSYSLMAGAGGSGARGGAGGSVSSINEISSNGVVSIIAGQGGTGEGSAGGAGGSIKGLNMESVSSAYTVTAGSGGPGAPGGAGGSVVGVNFGGNELSNGIIVAAPFTGNPNVDDILLIDSLSGNMVIEQNNGNGTGFTPVIQDSTTDLTTISSLGSDPVGAVAVTDSATHLPDIVVAYKNSDSLGVYINQGSGIFYTQDFTGGAYTGDTLDGTPLTLPYAPTQIAAGNFTPAGLGQPDLAVLANNSGQTELLTLAGNGLGAFTLLGTTVPIPGSNPVSLITADIQGGAYNDLFVGFQSGAIDSLLSTGLSSGAPFNVVPSGITVGGGLLNLDYNPQEGLLLALNGTGTDITTYYSDSGGALTQLTSLDLTTLPGTALVAHFVPETQTPNEPIEVLSAVGSGSRLDVWTPSADTFTHTSSVASTESLKNFVPVIEGNVSGVAAVGGSLEHFAFSQNGGPFFDVALPFSGKKVNIGAGSGGDGANGLTNVEAGGVGGSINGMSILAGDIILTAGNGGSSQDAPAGAGGAVVDSPVLVTITGESIPTIIEADFVLQITSGTGGSASGTVHTASGAAGGNIDGLNISLLQGDTQLTAGDGGSGGGGAGGNGGELMGIKSINYGGGLDALAGNGGEAYGSVGNGGAGGSILNFNHTLTLTDQLAENAYNITLTAGSGGQSASAIGGAGGSVGNLNLSLQPPNESVTDTNAVPATTHTNTDSTLRLTIAAGNGGDGATGGAGGAVKTINTTIVYDQLVVIIGATAQDTETFPEINPVAATLTAGNGGTGSTAAGGAGGAISTLNLVGISHYDPDQTDPQAGDSPLVITSGNGGNGATTGGVGGAILGVTSINAQFSVVSSTGAGTTGAAGSTTFDNVNGTELSGATIISGSGGSGTKGNGGAGGAITNLNVGVSGFYQDYHLTTSADPNGIYSGGQMSIQSGPGGNGGTAGKGGAGGNITSLTVGCADAYDEYGLLLAGGAGGTGTVGGGTGGSVTNIQLNSPQNPIPGTGLGNYDVLSTLILAGNGGGATGGSTTGATGGSISQIVEQKDVNTAINLIQAGNGGPGGKTGGLGGSVTGVQTVGLIGQASDDYGNSFGVFQTAADTAFFSTLFPAGIPQGVFAGDGGTGPTAGLAGSVSSINAAQIAAIGAAVNSSGLFAAAERVANITAEVIGYDPSGTGVYQNQAGVSTESPAQSVPIDGFLFSMTTPAGINTANNVLLQGFTFVG